MPTKDRYQISLKCFLHNPAGQVLILESIKGGTYEGYYDFPGGRINVDEFEVPLGVILEREIEEETGWSDVAIAPCPVAVGRHRIPAELSGDNLEKHVLYLFFKGQTKGSQAAISLEHTSFQWVDLGSIELPKYFTSGNLEGARMYVQEKTEVKKKT